MAKPMYAIYLPKNGYLKRGAFSGIFTFVKEPKAATLYSRVRSAETKYRVFSEKGVYIKGVGQLTSNSFEVHTIQFSHVVANVKA